jgi:hypothetical protein
MAVLLISLLSFGFLPMLQSHGAEAQVWASPLVASPLGSSVASIETVDDGAVDFIALGLEVTQVVQDLDNSVRLVENKRTFVRLHARTESGEHPAQATLSVVAGGESTTLLPVNAGQVVLISQPDRGVRDQGFLFELPQGFRSGTVALTAQVSPPSGGVASGGAASGSAADPNTANNTVTLSVTFEPVPTLSLVVYRLGYRVGGVDHWASSADRNQLVDWLNRTYPASDVRVWDRTLWLGDATVDEDGIMADPTCAQINTILLNKKIWDTAYGAAGIPADAHYYGMVDDGGGFLNGCALDGTHGIASGPTGDSSWGWDTDGSYGDWYGAALIAQTYGLDSIGFCGRPGDPAYPYPSGRISPSLTGQDALYGFDAGTQRIYSPGYKDIMSRCGLLWMSDVTYHQLMDRLQHVVQNVSSPSTEQTASGDRLLVSGTIHPVNMVIDLNPFFILPDVGELVPPTPGDFSIVLKNAEGAELARYPFAPTASGQVDGAADDESVTPMTFTELVPFVPGTATVEIRVPNSASVAGVSAQPGLPQVQFLPSGSGQAIEGPTFSVNWTGMDEDGDDLVYNVQYSADGGQSWEVVAMGVQGTSTEIDTANLSAGQDIRFRLWATDGIHTTSVESPSFTLANRAPHLKILTPETTAVATGQTVNLAARGYDLDSGPLAGADLRWASDLDGDLGTGTSLSLDNLSVGRHTISLSAQDTQGASDLQVIPLSVVGDAGEVPPPTDNLVVGPSLLSVEMRSNDTTYIYISNANLGRSVNWTIQPDQDWIKVGEVSGTTPAMIPVSVNWTSVNWTSVNWTSVNWTSVNWTSVNWTSVNWTSVNWTSVNWTSVNWTGQGPRAALLGSITITSEDLSTTLVVPLEAIVEPYPVFLPLIR